MSFPTGFFNCCSLVGQSVLGDGGLGGGGATGGFTSFGFSVGFTGGGGGGSCLRSKLFGSYVRGLNEGVPASQMVTDPLSSSSLRLTFSLLSLCDVTQPGILIIGVPTISVTGG